MACPLCGEATVYILEDPPAWVGRPARFICPVCLVDVRWHVAAVVPEVSGHRFRAVGSDRVGSFAGASRLRLRDGSCLATLEPMPLLEVADISPGSAEHLRAIRVRRGRRGRVEPIDDLEWGRPRAPDRSAAHRPDGSAQSSSS